MSKDLSAVNFSAKSLGEHWPSTLDELIAGWLEYWKDGQKDSAREPTWAFDAASDLPREAPNLALDFVLETLTKKPTAYQLRVLAAGPLEDVISNHGSEIIERVEIEARRNPQFRYLLGGVWQNATPEDIWKRVLAVAPERW